MRETFLHYKDRHGCQPADLDERGSIQREGLGYYPVVVYDQSRFTYYTNAQLDGSCKRPRTIHMATHCKSSSDKRIHLRR